MSSDMATPAPKHLDEDMFEISPLKSINRTSVSTISTLSSNTLSSLSSSFTTSPSVPRHFPDEEEEEEDYGGVTVKKVAVINPFQHDMVTSVASEIILLPGFHDNTESVDPCVDVFVGYIQGNFVENSMVSIGNEQVLVVGMMENKVFRVVREDSGECCVKVASPPSLWEYYVNMQLTQDNMVC